ncbi:ATP-binding protein [Emergencia timonensis]|uniref:ATP-binding protein n=1 Tax=Emergencia timonensis TaxID=1776384 RepID=UPI0008328323|nr:ATP-binding protein [Emergencia timonensis]WNX89620.1 ATP-binding protein [Emergencia timonensis]
MDWKSAAPILDNLPGGIGLFCYDGIGFSPVYISQQLLKTVKCSDLTELEQLVHHEDVFQLRGKAEALLQQQEPLIHDFRLLDRTSGEYFWLRLKANSQANEGSGQIIYAEVTDIDAEKKAETMLTLTEKTLFSVIEESGVQFWEYDIKHDRAYLGLKSRKDYKIEGIIENFPASWIETGYVHPDDVAEYLNMMARLKRDAGSVCFDARIWNPNLEGYEWKKIHYTAIADENGQPAKALAIAVDIHDFKHSEETLQAVMEQMGITSWEYDINNRTIVCNGGCAKTFDENDLIVKNIPEALLDKRDVHQDDADILMDGYQKLFDGESQVKFQCRYWVSRIAQYKWFETAYTVIRDEGGSFLRAIGTARDIEKQKRAEEQYQDQLKFMNDVSDETLIAKGRHNISKNKVEFSVERSSYAIPGMEGEAYDQFIEKLIRQPLRAHKREELSRILSRRQLIDCFEKGSNHFSVTYQRKTKDGKLIWVETTLRTFLQPGSEDIICFAYTYDRTDSVLQQQIVNRVADMEYDFLAILEVESESFRLVTVNGKAETQKMSKKMHSFESYKQDLKKSVLPEQQQQVIANLDFSCIIDRLRDSDTYFFMFSFIENGELRRKKLQFAYLDESKDLIMFTRSDMTDVYENEQAQLRRIATALREAEEANHAKTDFLSRVSHDLRTPMNAILGLSNLGLETDDVAELKGYMEKIQSSGQYLLSLINDTLDVNRIESDRLEAHQSKMNNLTLIEPVVSTGKILAKEKEVRFVVDLSGMTAGMIKGDIINIRRILNNLVSNAIKFTDPGGTVELKVEEGPSNNLRQRESMLYCFTVTDNGIGMSKSFMKSMYEPFAQENEASYMEKGSGLGLTIVKKLVELLGGEIEVKSALGKGTVFKIYLSLEKRETSAEEKEERFAEASMEVLYGKQILVCEDHPLNTLVVKKLLSKVGCTVTTAENGQLGLDIFRHSPPETFAAILMDIRMPVMDGLEAARQIRLLDEDVPIIALSANAYDVDEEKSAEAGMNAHLSKPIEPQLLYETLLKYVNFR